MHRHEKINVFNLDLKKPAELLLKKRKEQKVQQSRNIKDLNLTKQRLKNRKKLTLTKDTNMKRQRKHEKVTARIRQRLRKTRETKYCGEGDPRVREAHDQTGGN